MSRRRKKYKEPMTTSIQCSRRWRSEGIAVTSRDNPCRVNSSLTVGASRVKSGFCALKLRWLSQNRN
jgi:hypothetical protein